MTKRIYILAVLLLAVLAPASRANDEAVSKANMVLIGEAIGLYYNTNDHTVPTKLSQLYEQGLVSSLGVFVAPGSKTLLWTSEDIDEKGDYAIVVSGDPRSGPILRERYGFHNGKALELQADRSFRLVTAPTPPPAETQAVFKPVEDAPDLVAEGMGDKAREWLRGLSPPGDWRGWARSPGVWVGVSVGLYVYVTLCLIAIAARTRTPGAWMAPFPVLNMVLMFHIAGMSGWWILLLWVPVLNIVLMLLCLVGIARATNRGVWTVLLVLLPLLNLLVLLYWASGKRPAEADGSRPAAASAAAPPGRHCTHCGKSVRDGDNFCHNCGTKVGGAATPAAAPQQAGRRTPSSAGGVVVAIVLLLIIAATAAFGAIAGLRTLSEQGFDPVGWLGQQADGTGGTSTDAVPVMPPSDSFAPADDEMLDEAKKFAEESLRSGHIVTLAPPDASADEELPTPPAPTAANTGVPGMWFWIQKRNYNANNVLARGRGAMQSAGMLITRSSTYWVSGESDLVQSCVACLPAGDGSNWVYVLSTGLAGADLSAHTQQLVATFDAGGSDRVVTQKPAGAAPELWFWVKARNYSLANSLARGRAALAAQGFTVENSGKEFVAGQKGNVRVSFIFTQAGPGSIWAMIFLTAKRGSSLADTRDQLVKAFDLGADAPTRTSPDH